MTSSSRGLYRLSGARKLVDRMNRVGSNQKVAALAAVINELVAQRKLMRSHMRRMMGDTGRPPD